MDDAVAIAPERVARRHLGFRDQPRDRSASQAQATRGVAPLTAMTAPPPFRPARHKNLCGDAIKPFCTARPFKSGADGLTLEAIASFNS